MFTLKVLAAFLLVVIAVETQNAFLSNSGRSGNRGINPWDSGFGGLGGFGGGFGGNDPFSRLIKANIKVIHNAGKKSKDSDSHSHEAFQKRRNLKHSHSKSRRRHGHHHTTTPSPSSNITGGDFCVDICRFGKPIVEDEYQKLVELYKNAKEFFEDKVAPKLDEYQDKLDDYLKENYGMDLRKTAEFVYYNPGLAAKNAIKKYGPVVGKFAQEYAPFIARNDLGYKAYAVINYLLGQQLANQLKDSLGFDLPTGFVSGN